MRELSPAEQRQRLLAAQNLKRALVAHLGNVTDVPAGYRLERAVAFGGAAIGLDVRDGDGRLVSARLVVNVDHVAGDPASAAAAAVSGPGENA